MSKVSIHLAESVKMLIILPSKRDHTKCMLFLFSMTGVGKIFHIKMFYHVVAPREKDSLIYKMNMLKSMHALTSYTVLLPEWSTSCCFFVLVIVVHEVSCLSEQLNRLLFIQKNHSDPHNSWFSRHFCVFEPFSINDCVILRSIFFTLRTNWGTPIIHYTEDSNAHWCSRSVNPCIKRRGVQNFLNLKIRVIELNLSSEKHVTIFCCFRRAAINEKILYLGITRQMYTSSFCSKFFTPRLLTRGFSFHKSYSHCWKGFMNLSRPRGY